MTRSRCLCLLPLLLALQSTRALLPRKPPSRYFACDLDCPPLKPLHHGSGTQPANHLPTLYTNDPKQVSLWLADHVPVDGGILGLDVESVPTGRFFRSKPTVQGSVTVQLATPHGALVVQLLRSNGRPSRACHPILQAVLSDESIVKVGVGIDDDCVDLYECFGTETRSRLDLLGLQLDDDRSGLGVASLAEHLLGLELHKPKKISMSNWSLVPLSDRQLVYAARDAWVPAAVVDVLQRHDDRFQAHVLPSLLSHQRPIAEIAERRQIKREARKQRKLTGDHQWTLVLQANGVDPLPLWKVPPAARKRY